VANREAAGNGVQNVDNDEVSMHWMANMALLGFPPEERDEITRAIESIAEPNPDHWPRVKVFKLDLPGDVYILHVNPKIRVIFQLTEKRTVQILDMVLRETLLTFASKDN
jgi:hypothetical protein